MNIAYLLVGTACIAGQAEKIPAPATPAPPVVGHPAPIPMHAPAGPGCCDSGGGGNGGCGDSCGDSCCESSSWGHRMRHRMRGLFRRGHGGGDDCCSSGCDNGGCGGSIGGSIGGGCGGTPFVPHGVPYGAPPAGQPGKGAEKIPAPMGDGTAPPVSRMPSGGTPLPATQQGGQVQINVAPAAPVPSATPRLQSAPSAAPAVDGNSEQRPF